MENALFNKINKTFKLLKKDTGEFHVIKTGTVRALTDAYEVEGIGNLSISNMKVLGGLMTIKSICLTSSKKDIPLFSFDLVKVFKKETLLLELYNTNLEKIDISALIDIKNKYKDIQDGEQSESWLTPLKLECSLKKVDKNKHNRMLELVNEWSDALITIIKNGKDCDEEEKNKKNREYVDGLLTNGGPSTDFLKKKIGQEKTKEYFYKYFFGVE